MLPRPPLPPHRLREVPTYHYNDTLFFEYASSSPAVPSAVLFGGVAVPFDSWQEARGAVHVVKVKLEKKHQGEGFFAFHIGGEVIFSEWVRIVAAFECPTLSLVCYPAESDPFRWVYNPDKGNVIHIRAEGELRPSYEEGETYTEVFFDGRKHVRGVPMQKRFRLLIGGHYGVESNRADILRRALMCENVTLDGETYATTGETKITSKEAYPFVFLEIPVARYALPRDSYILVDSDGSPILDNNNTAVRL